MNRVYLAGSGGMLGQAIYEEYREHSELRCTDIDVNDEWLEYLDFRDFEAYRQDVRSFRPDCLFHLGALTDLEYCETNPDDAYATNALSVENAVRIANELDVPVVYIGTAGIFDGGKDSYDDWDTPNPLSVYGRAKWAGEAYVEHHARRHVICRAGWMMGGGPRKDKKFVQKLMSQLHEGSRDLKVVNDRMGTPTYTRDFARNLRLVLESGWWGRYNMVCHGATSRLEVARELVKQLGMQDSVTVEPVDSAFFAGVYFAPRPESERLINRKLSLRGLDQMRPWPEALAEYLQRDYAGYVSA